MTTAADQQGRTEQDADRKDTTDGASPKKWWLHRRLWPVSPEVQASWQQAVELIDGYEGHPHDGRLTHEECQILKSRWVVQTKNFERLWRNQRGFYHFLRIPIILGATTIPVLASLSVDRLATALVGLVVAALTGLDSYFQLRDRWQQHRRTATDLESQGWAFLELSGDYEGKSRREAYKLFIGRLESINNRAAQAYLNIFDRPGEGANQPTK